MNRAAESICMYAPTSYGGHAWYTQEMMTALTRHAAPGQSFELVTSSDLQPAYQSTVYPIHAILPPIRERATFPNPLAWAWDRITYYPRRERFFLRWLATRPDITTVHFQEFKPWLARSLFRPITAMGKKCFYTVHNVVPHHFPPAVPPALMLRWLRNGCRMCDGLFTLSSYLSGELDKFLGPAHPPIFVVPHGTKTSPKVSGLPLNDRLAARRLLFFGILRRNKGLHLLLDAMEQLPQYSLTIAGEIGEPDYFRNDVLPKVQKLQTAGRKIELNANFIPESDLASIFAAHSAVVLPYTRHFVAQSGVVFMAIAHGIPLVSSEAGGLRELFGDFRIGVSFAESTPQLIVSAIRQLFEKLDVASLSEQLSGARDYYTWDRAAHATLAGYAAVNNGATERLYRNECQIQSKYAG